VDGTGSGLCPVWGFGIGDFKIRVLLLQNLYPGILLRYKYYKMNIFNESSHAAVIYLL
jgi:hypothetical protein